MRYRRNEQVTETTVDDGSFLVEPETQDIFYLDGLSRGIWTALVEPMSLGDLQRLVRDAFPEVPGGTVETDIASLLDDMTRRRLVMTGE
jgi:hypothetical protein